MRRTLAVIAAVSCLVAAAVIAGLTLSRDHRAAGPPCTVTANGRRFQLDRPQVANASTIADAANRLGLPHHAVTVALVAAFQESGMHNLSHGDRDSLGLFQQRPSQGWGTPAQLLDPPYASEAFLRSLARVRDWATMPVGDAAQRVQRSATPHAYARWENEARVVARVVTGEVRNGLSCVSS